MSYRRLYDVLHECDEKRVVHVKSKDIWELVVILFKKLHKRTPKGSGLLD